MSRDSVPLTAATASPGSGNPQPGSYLLICLNAAFARSASIEDSTASKRHVRAIRKLKQILESMGGPEVLWP